MLTLPRCAFSEPSTCSIQVYPEKHASFNVARTTRLVSAGCPTAKSYTLGVLSSNNLPHAQGSIYLSSAKSTHQSTQSHVLHSTCMLPHRWDNTPQHGRGSYEGRQSHPRIFLHPLIYAAVGNRHGQGTETPRKHAQKQATSYMQQAT